MRNDLIFILKNVEWKSENKKKRDTEISEDQYITVLHAGNHILILYV